MFKLKFLFDKEETGGGSEEPTPPQPQNNDVSNDIKDLKNELIKVRQEMESLNQFKNSNNKDDNELIDKEELFNEVIKQRPENSKEV